MKSNVVSHATLRDFDSYKTIAWRVCLIASLFFFYEFLQLNLIDSINSGLAASFHLSAEAISSLSAMYFWGNFILVVPAGMLLDRFSTKKLILIAMAICTISTIIFALSTSYTITSLCRLAEGIGAGFCFLAPMRLASRWFPSEKLAFITGAIVTMAMLGGMVAQTPFSMLTDLIGWRNAMLCDAGLGVVLFIIMFFFIQDKPPGHEEGIVHGEEVLHELGLWKCMKLVFGNIQTWMCALFTSLLNLPIFLLGAIWGIPYLTQTHNFSRTEASVAVAMLFFGSIIGSPLYGWVSDTVGLRKTPMIVGSVVSLCCIIAIIYLPNLSLIEAIGMFFMLGLFTSAQVLSYPVIAESNPSALTSSAVSVVSLTIMLSGALSQPFFGRLMESHWDKTITNGVPIYSATDYHLAMLIMPISFIFSLILAFLIRETGGHHLRNDF